MLAIFFHHIASTNAPPSKTPKEASECRFHHIAAATEWIESYRPGGLHPIHLGNTLDGGRYKILRYGSFSTVWLARDAQESRYVAVKVSVAGASETNNEHGVFEYLGRHHDQRDAQYIMELLRSFEHEGPNGHHLCLMFPLMGPSASAMKRMTFGTQGDIEPGNILFSLPNVDSLPESDLQTDIIQSGTISKPVQRVDGEIDLWSPPYTVIPRPLTDLVTLEPGFMIRISDMGGASLIAMASATKPLTPVALRAPELIFKGSWDVSVDIWSFGCLLFEFLTGTSLFAISTWGLTAEAVDEEHIKQLVVTLGPLPEELRAQWPRYSSLYFDDGIEVEKPPLELFLKRKAPPEMDAVEVEVVGALLREILQYDPAKWPTAVELLKNPWFEAIGESK